MCEGGGIGRRARLRGVWLYHASSSLVPRTNFIAGSMLPAMSSFFCAKAQRAPCGRLCGRAGFVLSCSGPCAAFCAALRACGPRGAVFFFAAARRKGAAAHRGGTFVAKQENDLGRDAIGKLVLRIAVPSMLAQFVSVLYSIVDRMYIGNIPVVGDVAPCGRGRVRPGGYHGGQRGLSDWRGRRAADEH